MRVKIHEGPAARGGPSLCLSCRHATVIQGSLSGQQIVECGLLSSRDCRITFPVESCTGYSDRSLPSLRAMEEIAWVLRTDPLRKQVGFVHARKLDPRDRYVLDDE
jgi:hypothetical protein